MVALIQLVAAICVIAATWFLNSPGRARRWGSLLGMTGMAAFQVTTAESATVATSFVSFILVIAYARGVYRGFVTHPLFPSLRRTRKG